MKGNDAEPQRALSIRSYAIIFLLIVSTFLFGIGIYSYNKVEAARQGIKENNMLAAEEEMLNAIANLLGSIDVLSKTVSAWDEIHQQIANPEYYSYWREHRFLSAGVLPAHVVSAEIYDSDGVVLAAIAGSRFPNSIDVEELEPYLESAGDYVYLVAYAAIQRVGGSSPTGYLGVRIPVIETLQSTAHFYYVDETTLRHTASVSYKLPLSQLSTVIGYRQKPSIEADAMMRIVDDAAFRLAIVVGLLSVFFYILLVYVLGKPIISLSRHIDHLIDGVEESSRRDEQFLFPVGEIERVKESLNRYHSDLQRAHVDLDEKNKELWVQAHHDSLTGMLNRRAYELELNNSRQLLSHRRVGIGLILFDVNHFKAINDSYGHHAGDEVLIAISSCIQGVLRGSEKLYRIGGDEFAVIVIGSTPDEEIVLSQRCLDAVNEYDFARMGIKENVRISCGIAYCQADEVEKLNNLQMQADVAVYQAKKPGVTHPVLYSDEMVDGTESVFSSWINNAVYDAVTLRKGIELHYQPIVNNDSRMTAYFEVLLRIRHGEEMIPPSHIFPIVSMRQIETELDIAIIERVAQDLSEQLIPKNTGVSINLSAESLGHKNVIDWLIPLTDYTQSYYIVIEVTETSLITQMAVASRNLTLLRKLGFKVALDDFGSGYSSLRYLTSMPVDIIKFDISLIHGMQDERMCQLVTELAGLLGALDYTLVAEGIETDRLLEQVISAGFKFSQGYLFGEPTNAREVTFAQRFRKATVHKLYN